MTTEKLDVRITFMEVTIDKQKCIGCGTCVAIAPKSFKLGDDGRVEVIDPAGVIEGDLIAGDSEAKVKEAAESCPVSAITLNQ